MKTTLKFICIALIAISLSLSFSSCATMFGKKGAELVFVNYPKGIRVKNNGESKSLERIQAHATASDKSTTTYYAQGIMLDKKIKRHTVTLEHDGKKGTVEVKLRPGAKWIVLDFFTGGILGWGIDAATKKWRVANHKFVDVTAVLNGTKPKSQGQLKRTIKREARG